MNTNVRVLAIIGVIMMNGFATNQMELDFVESMLALIMWIVSLIFIFGVGEE